MSADTEFETVGERLVGRSLEKETRCGVEHYVPGQHFARIFAGIEYGTDRPSQIGRVTYVDVMGHACVVLTYRYMDGDEPSEWFATWCSRAGQMWQTEVGKIEGDFPLSVNMLKALAEAEIE